MDQNVIDSWTEEDEANYQRGQRNGDLSGIEATDVAIEEGARDEQEKQEGTGLSGSSK